MSEPRRTSAVSVIIPVKNGERYLAEAIDSVVAQTQPPFEIIVVDGGSTDRSAEIAGSYPKVSLIEQRGTGLGGAWNDGIAASSGDLIAFLDSDDRWLPGKLEAQVELLGRDPGTGAVVGRTHFFIEPGFEPPPGFRPEFLDGDQLGLIPGALLVRRRTFDQIGVFDESYEITSDVDWFARLKDAGVTLGRVSEVVLEKRFHDSNLSHRDLSQNDGELVRLLRDSIKRQERESG